MSFQEFYQSRIGPRSPIGWRFCSSAVTDFVVLSDELRTKDKWRQLTSAQLNDPKHPRPIRCNSFLDAHMIDIPPQSSSLTDDQMRQRDAAVDAFDYAFARLGEIAEAGFVSTACRAKTGGGLQMLSPEIWGIDDFWSRMVCCALNPDMPYDCNSEATHWLFFEEDAFQWHVDRERLLHGLTPRYHRRFAPLSEQRSDDAYPGKDETRNLLQHWIAFKDGNQTTASAQSMGIITCKNLPVPVIGSGSAGRPTSKHVVLAFLKERIEGGLVEASLNKEAEALAFLFEEWRKSKPEHAAWPAMELGTIKNNIRETYNSRKSKM